jgi:hypothetical protein
LFEIKARGKFNRRHMVDIPRIKFFAQRRYRANWPFVDGHELGAMSHQRARAAIANGWFKDEIAPV